MLERKDNYNLNTDNIDFMYSNHKLAEMHYKSLTCQLYNMIEHLGAIIRNYMCQDIYERVQLRNANGNVIWATPTKGINVEQRYTWWISMHMDCGSMVSKLIDAFEDKENIVYNTKYNIFHGLKIRDENNIESDIGIMLRFLGQDKIRFCVVDGIAYENIDPIFQKYLYRKVDNWITFIINNPACLMDVHNKYELIYGILNMDKEQLKRVEKKSIFIEQPVFLYREYLSSEKINIELLTKSKDYRALDPIVHKLNRKINGYDTIINYKDIAKFTSYDFDDIKPVDTTNHIYKTLVDSINDNYIQEMIKGLPEYGKNGTMYSIDNICGRFDINLPVFNEAYLAFGLSIQDSIYLAMLERLLYGITFDYQKLSNNSPNVMLYNYFILGEHQSALSYIDNPKDKVIELLKKHKEIMDKGLMETDMNILYHTIGTNDMKLLEMQEA